MPADRPKILVIEDDPHIQVGLQELLESEGFAVAIRVRGDQAEEAVRRERPALVILDVMLPGLSGYDVCKRLRQDRVGVPILMLTAKGQEIDKVVGLELGADDYLSKPFGVRELLARIHALLRRAASAPGGAAAARDPFPIGDAVIDPRTFQIRRGAIEEELTARELKLLQFFSTHPGEVLSRDQLLNEVSQRLVGQDHAHKTESVVTGHCCEAVMNVGAQYPWQSFVPQPSHGLHCVSHA